MGLMDENSENCIRRYEVIYQRGGRGIITGVDGKFGLGVRVGMSVDVGKGVALGIKPGSRQAGIESTRAAGSRVCPNWS